MALLAAGGGVPDRLERDRGGGGGGVGRHPAPQHRRVPDRLADLVEVAVDDAVEIAVEVEATRPRRERPDRRKAGGEHLLDVALQADGRLALDGRRFTREQAGQAHRRAVELTLGEGERSHPDAHDPSGARMRRLLPRDGRSGEQELTGRSSRIDGVADEVPRLG